MLRTGFVMFRTGFVVYRTGPCPANLTLLYPKVFNHLTSRRYLFPSEHQNSKSINHLVKF